jgi:hypothetical protein
MTPSIALFTATSQAASEGDHLSQDPHGGADLRVAPFVVYQAVKDFFPDGLLCWCESAICPPL